jgi:hypothetical protein
MKALHRWLMATATASLLACGGGQEPLPGQADALPQAAPAEDAAFFSWAERAYPGFFTGAATEGVAGIYSYRFYPASGNYLALANGGVYVLGPISAGAIQFVAPRTAFACQITPADCPAALPAPVRIAVPGSLSVTDTTSARTVQVYLTAATSYHFTLQGAATGEGSLADPVLRLLDPQGTEVASNDDHGNLDSRIAWTAAAAGTYTLSVSGHRGGTGTYRLSAAVNPLVGDVPGDANPLYYRWPLTASNERVYDAHGAIFRVRTADGVVVDAAGVEFPELKFNTDTGAVTLGARTIGRVAQYRSPTTVRFGTSRLYCTDSSAMEITRTDGVWKHSCGWATSEGTRALGTRSDAALGETFITWSEGAGADVVLDATDASYRFAIPVGSFGNGCLFSDAARRHYSNFCQFSGAPLILFDNAVYTITRVRSKSGACITALLTSDGFTAEIRADSSRVVSVAKGIRRPAVC